ncbi:hypothetical protein HYZ05_01500 [Candidatus Daviesbacteria bacterium]|nr:hypothetical protein [Candidatus Daviesbacteria bacterium]
MEKVILKTLIYADIFDYPLTIFEIHKWLIGRKATLRQVEKALRKLNQESRQRQGSPKAARIKNQGEYYFLSTKDGLVAKRKQREKQSEKYLRKARILTQILKLVPWIKLVGISGGLAMDNAGKSDDIDLFIITSNNRLWISRFLAVGILDFMGVRRKVGINGRKIAGKLCINTLLEEDRLGQRNKDIYLAHEVLQMKVLWQRDGVYSKYLLDNEWAFKFLPNWIAQEKVSNEGKVSNVSKVKTKKTFDTFRLGAFLEKIAKKFQLWYMQKPQGMERMEDGALYFHPNDIRPKILKLYKQKTGTP